MWQKGAKMKWKNRLTNYNFWISIVSATLLILQAFNIKLDIANINEIVTALLGLLVVIGIINDPTKSGKEAENIKEKTNTKALQIKHNGCVKTKIDDGQGAKDTTQIDVLNEEDNSSQTENSNITNSVENCGGNEFSCPVCEDVEIAKNEQEDLLQNAENQTMIEQSSTDLNNQTFEAVMENDIPSAKQNEADYDLAENDLQVLINQISMDLKNKYAELSKLADGLNFATKKADNINSKKIENDEDNQLESVDNKQSNSIKQTESVLQDLTNDNSIQQANCALNCDIQPVKVEENDTEITAENIQNNLEKQPETPTHFNIVN